MTSLLRNGRFLGDPVHTLRTSDLVLADMRYPAGLRLPRHEHERPYICLIRQGAYAEQYGRRNRGCHPGMVVYHPAGEHHCQHMHGEDVSSFNIEIGPFWQMRMHELGAFADQPVEFEGGRARTIANSLLREVKQDDADSLPAIEHLLWELLGEVRQFTSPRLSASAPAWLARLREALRARLQEPLSLRGIAAEFDVHPIHLAATFRRHFGCSVGEFLRRERVQAAGQMLNNTGLTLTQIALEAGFADQSHLTRTFKRLTGMTPGQYRSFLPFKTR